MAVLHYGMMRATARMNEELDAAGVIDPKVAAGMFDLNKREAAEARRLPRVAELRWPPAAGSHRRFMTFCMVPSVSPHKRP
jgi:hypothetical protein